MSFSVFSFPTTILFGAGAIQELPKELAKRGMLRPLLVTDAGLLRTPVFECVSKLTPGAAVYSGVEPNPTERNVLDGVECYRQSKCDGIVGLGGGSPLDAAPSLLPSAVVTVRALARLAPVRARLPSTVTTSPSFIVSRSQPRCCS